MKKMIVLLLGSCLLFAGCAPATGSAEPPKASAVATDSPKAAAAGEYVKITPQKAKEIMDDNKDVIILDVRTAQEFGEGHIENATLLTDSEISSKAEEVLPDKSAEILVYCRSGRRSEAAARELIDMGYTNVKNFGGIVDWPYETVV